jgi:predicted small lipoprotein YifL
MFKNCNFYRIILMAGSLLLLTFCLTACGQKSPVGNPIPATNSPAGDVTSTPLAVLSDVAGSVLVTKSGGTGWLNGETGMPLGPDDKIRTEAGSSAAVTFFEGSTVELEAGTEISLAELGQAGTTTHIKIKQEIGNTLSRVKKLVDPASSYEVQTVAAIASVRGTTLTVYVDENGVTTVGNIEGKVSVTAQGIEVMLPEGTSSTTVPGETPGEPKSNNTPPPSDTPTASPTVTPTPTPQPDVVKIAIEKTCDVSTAYPGDNVTYTYRVSNAGDVPLSDILVTDDKIGEATFIGGDVNSDALLDTDEIWIIEATYTIREGDLGQLTNIATVSGTGPNGQEATARATAVINVIDIAVKITSLVPDEKYGRNITVAGTVNDPSITQAVLTLNGTPRNITVDSGQFSTMVELEDGENKITVTVTKADGITRTASVTLVPED